MNWLRPFFHPCIQLYKCTCLNSLLFRQYLLQLTTRRQQQYAMHLMQLLCHVGLTAAGHDIWNEVASWSVVICICPLSKNVPMTYLHITVSHFGMTWMGNVGIVTDVKVFGTMHVVVSYRCSKMWFSEIKCERLQTRYKLSYCLYVLFVCLFVCFVVVVVFVLFCFVFTL